MTILPRSARLVKVFEESLWETLVSFSLSEQNNRIERYDGLCDASVSRSIFVSLQIFKCFGQAIFLFDCYIYP